MPDQPKPTEPQPKLEPCPFCGKPAECREFKFGGESFWIMSCTNAECSSPPWPCSSNRDRIIAAWNNRPQFLPLPEGISRADAIAGLREIVGDAESAEREKDPSFKRYPTVHALLDFIEINGFPAPNKQE